MSNRAFRKLKGDDGIIQGMAMAKDGNKSNDDHIKPEESETDSEEKSSAKIKSKSKNNKKLNINRFELVSSSSSPSFND